MKLKKFPAEYSDFEVELPARRIVCPRCDGDGTHTNPAIDGHGISPEEFAEDPDFEEGYFSGRYDVQCEECRGERVLDEPDEDACKKRLSWYKGLIRYYRWIQAESDHRAECEAERRFGA